MTPFYASPYTTLSRAPGGAVVLFQRSDEAYPSAASVEQDFAGIRAGMGVLPMARMGLLIDLTAVRGRNDASFEHAVAPHRAWMFRSFGAVGLVVRTEVGRLQVQRHLREDGFDHAVFLSRDDALAYLAEKVTAPAARRRG